MRKKLHPDFNIHDNDRVFITNQDGTVDYALVTYIPDMAAYMLVFYIDKYFNTVAINGEGFDDIEYISAIGFDLLERVDDYVFDELY